MTDSSGVVTNTYRTDEWGIPTSTTGSSGQPLKFTGEPRDATGLTYLRTRYYDPELGRFLTRDMWPGVPTVPQTQNRYSYATNNPTTYADPSGRFIDTAVDIAFIVYDVASILFGPEKDREGNLLALAADVASAFIPFVTGGGIAVRAGREAIEHADEVIGPIRWAQDAAAAACSFTPETLVATPDGPVAISLIEVGDVILAWDMFTGTVVERRVSAVLPHPDDEIARLTIEGVVVTTTPDHPFFTFESGWVEAGMLWPGAHVLSTTGSAVVASVEIKPFAGTLWDLTVEGVHTFFVGSREVLVHNCNFGNYIANGHAWEKHVVKGGEFPGVTSKEQFANLVDDIIHNSANAGELKSGGWGYWKDGTMVIINPGNVDGGTAFRPAEGFAYFVSQLVNP